MNTVFAIAGVVIKELYRRKDAYVLFFLTLLITLIMAAGSFFNDTKIVGYLKEICLSLIWISTLVIAVATAARQIPAERENRTIFPLLAKPVTRGQVVMGKFLGCWLASGLTLVVFYVLLLVISWMREGSWNVRDFVTLGWMHWMFLGIVIALVLWGSIVFAAPSSNATITIVIVLGIMMLGRQLNKVAADQPQPGGTIVYAIYFLIPHLEWFDLHEKFLFHTPTEWIWIAQATLYAAAYTGTLLYLTWLAFRRKALTT